MSSSYLTINSGTPCLACNPASSTAYALSGVSLPPTTAATNKTPLCGCPPRLLPIAGGGGTTLSSPPHSVGCLTQHATNKPPLCGCPPRLLPIAGGGDHTLFSTPLRGVSNPTCLNET